MDRHKQRSRQTVGGRTHYRINEWLRNSEFATDICLGTSTAMMTSGGTLDVSTRARSRSVATFSILSLYFRERTSLY